jgi:hypothetical protein
VRKDLADRHSITSVNWITSRKVAAVGFGNEAPPEAPPAGTVVPQAPRRVEIILFTPQA